MSKSTALIGDSVTYGVGLEKEDTFAYKLDALFTNHNFINFSTSGYGALQYTEVIKNLVINQGIKKFVLFFCMNDFDNDSYEARYFKKDNFGISKALLKENTILQKMLKNSHLVRILYLKLISKKYLYGENISHISRINDFTSKIEILKKEHGLKIIFVILPQGGEKFNFINHNIFSTHLRAPDIETIDLHSIFSLNNGLNTAKDKLFLEFNGIPDPVHYSRRGHELVAVELSKYLKISNLE